jgi:hypothetical protein
LKQIAYNYATKIFPNYKKQLHIIKCAVGGTSLISKGVVQNDWSEDNDQLWYTFLNFVYKPAILDILMSGKKTKLVGIYWGQGESDTNTNNEANAYESNLRSLITNRFRSKLGFSDAKIYIMGLSNHSDSNNWNTVKSAQISVCEGLNKLKDVYLIRTDGSNDTPIMGRYGSSVRAGTIHYSTIGVIDIGDQIFELLDFNKMIDYTGCYDFELVSSVMKKDDPIIKSKMYRDPFTVGLISIANLPHESLIYKRGLTWFNDPITPGRVNIASQICPNFRILPLDNATDQEIICSFSVQADIHTRCGIILRGDHPPLTSFNTGRWTSGIHIQFRQQYEIDQLTIYLLFVENPGFLLLPKFQNPVQNYVIGETINYKVTLIDKTLKIYTSRTLLSSDWVLGVDYTDITFPISGNTYCALYAANALTTPPYNYDCSYDNIIATRL